MNEFNKKLDLARRKQKRSFIAFAGIVCIILTAILAFLAISRSTRVEVLPMEISQTADIKVTMGFGFCFNNTVYSISAMPEITVTAPGFQDVTTILGPPHLGKVLPVELSELPGRLTVAITNSDNDLSRTRWLVDETPVATGPEIDIELKAGNHTLIVDNPFYQRQEVPVELQRGTVEKYTVNLVPITGTAHISSKPTGATVSVNNEKLGHTPLEFPLSGGSHSLQVTSEYYIDIVEEVSILRHSAEVRRMYQLERKKVEISFDLTPTGGILLINGVITKDPALLDAMVEHTVTYKKNGYYPTTKNITLKPDEMRTLSLSLQQEKGRVSISSTPPAKVFVGTKEYGVSPLTLTLPALEQKITLRKDGYREVTRVIRPQGNSDKRISITLLTEYQARLQESPREFTNSVGIDLKLFMPKDTFIMGAPRSEKGQRANEFQRKIHLSKPFYASVHEITNAQFGQFSQKKFSGPGNNPVTSISWQQAAAYCNWLSKKERLRPFYYTSGGRVNGFDAQADGYRLLSEAEWEWLVRKSGRTRQTLFSWGNETTIPPKSANIADESARGQVRYYVPGYNDGFAAIAPVGSFTVEQSGLHDQAGNVSEWVHDVYSITPAVGRTTEPNPLGQSFGQIHTIKGANWRSGTITTLRPAFREGLSAGQDDVGFRIARYLYGREK